MIVGFRTRLVFLLYTSVMIVPFLMTIRIPCLPRENQTRGYTEEMRDLVCRIGITLYGRTEIGYINEKSVRLIQKHL